MISTVFEKTIVFMYQVGRNTKNGSKIMYGFKNILPKNKTKVKLCIHKIAR